VGNDGKVIIVQKKKTPGRKSQKLTIPKSPLQKNLQDELKKKIEKKIENAWDWKA
jgi:hypothetical protein